MPFNQYGRPHQRHHRPPKDRRDPDCRIPERSRSMGMPCANSSAIVCAVNEHEPADAVLGRVEDDRDLFSCDVSFRIRRVTALRPYSARAQPTPRQQQPRRQLAVREKAPASAPKPPIFNMFARANRLFARSSPRVRTRPIALTGGRPALSGARKARERKQHNHHRRRHAADTAGKRGLPGGEQPAAVVVRGGGIR